MKWNFKTVNDRNRFVRINSNFMELSFLSCLFERFPAFSPLLSDV